MNPLVDVMDARTAITQAKGLYYQSIHRHTVARLGLKRALGILGPQPGESESVSARDILRARLPEFEKQ